MLQGEKILPLNRKIGAGGGLNQEDIKIFNCVSCEYVTTFKMTSQLQFRKPYTSGKSERKRGKTQNRKREYNLDGIWKRRAWKKDRKKRVWT